MSLMAAYRTISRSVKFNIGDKPAVQNQTFFVNLDNKRAQRDLARHVAIGQLVQVSGTRYQFDSGTVEQGGKVTPRTGSLVLDVGAANVLSTDNVTKGASAAGTATLVPNATSPELAAVGLDTSTFATPTIVTPIYNTPAATITEARTLSSPFTLPTLPATDTTAARIWLAYVWVPPSLTGITSVAGTGVITTGSAHGYVVGDQVWFNTLTGGTGIVVNTLYTVTSVPSATTFVTTATHSTNLTAGTVQRQILAADVLDVRP